MANTQHSITTRRAILTGIASTAAATAALAVPTASATTTDGVLAAWRTWRPLIEEFNRISDEANRIEKALPVWARNGPDIRINELEVYHPDKVDQVISQLPDWLKPASEQLRECALRGWHDGWARVDAERERAGLTWRGNRMDEITDLEDGLITLIENAGGSHPIVMAAKIHLTLAKAPDSELLEDLPWSVMSSAIRGVLSELPGDMQAALALIAAGEGTLRDALRPAVEALS